MPISASRPHSVNRRRRNLLRTLSTHPSNPKFNVFTLDEIQMKIADTNPIHAGDRGGEILDRNSQLKTVLLHNGAIGNTSTTLGNFPVTRRRVQTGT